jgi:hypothetical protein
MVSSKKERVDRAKKIYARFKAVFDEANRNDAPIVARAFQAWADHAENKYGKQ